MSDEDTLSTATTEAPAETEATPKAESTKPEDGVDGAVESDASLGTELPKADEAPASDEAATGEEPGPGDAAEPPSLDLPFDDKPVDSAGGEAPAETPADAPAPEDPTEEPKDEGKDEGEQADAPADAPAAIPAIPATEIDPSASSAAATPPTEVGEGDKPGIPAPISIGAPGTLPSVAVGENNVALGVDAQTISAAKASAAAKGQTLGQYLAEQGVEVGSTPELVAHVEDKHGLETFKTTVEWRVIVKEFYSAKD